MCACVCVCACAWVCTRGRGGGLVSVFVGTRVCVYLLSAVFLCCLQKHTHGGWYSTETCDIWGVRNICLNSPEAQTLCYTKLAFMYTCTHTPAQKKTHTRTHTHCYNQQIKWHQLFYVLARYVYVWWGLWQFVWWKRRNFRFPVFLKQILSHVMQY